MKRHTLFLALTHPVFMPVYIMAYLLFGLNFLLYKTSDAILLWSYFSVILTGFPLGVLFFLYQGKIIQSFEMPTLKERRYALFTVAAAYFFVYYIFRDKSLFFLFQTFFLSGFIIAGTAFVISFFWKISLHTLGFGFFLGFMIILSWTMDQTSWMPMVISVLLAGLVGAQRIYSKAHTPAQVYAGFLAGVTLTLIVFALTVLLPLS